MGSNGTLPCIVHILVLLTNYSVTCVRACACACTCVCVRVKPPLLNRAVASQHVAVAAQASRHSCGMVCQTGRLASACVQWECALYAGRHVTSCRVIGQRPRRPAQSAERLGWLCAGGWRGPALQRRSSYGRPGTGLSRQTAPVVRRAPPSWSLACCRRELRSRVDCPMGRLHKTQGWGSGKGQVAAAQTAAAFRASIERIHRCERVCTRCRGSYRSLSLHLLGAMRSVPGGRKRCCQRPGLSKGRSTRTSACVVSLWLGRAPAETFKAPRRSNLMAEAMPAMFVKCCCWMA